MKDMKRTNFIKLTNVPNALPLGGPSLSKEQEANLFAAVKYATFAMGDEWSGRPDVVETVRALLDRHGRKPGTDHQ